jgi:hypothetical protein
MAADTAEHMAGTAVGMAAAGNQQVLKTFI